MNSPGVMCWVGFRAAALWGRILLTDQSLETFTWNCWPSKCGLKSLIGQPSMTRFGSRMGLLLTSPVRSPPGWMKTSLSAASAKGHRLSGLCGRRIWLRSISLFGALWRTLSTHSPSIQLKSWKNRSGMLSCCLTPICALKFVVLWSTIAPSASSRMMAILKIADFVFRVVVISLRIDVSSSQTKDYNRWKHWPNRPTNARDTSQLRAWVFRGPLVSLLHFSSLILQTSDSSLEREGGILYVHTYVRTPNDV